MLFNVWFIHDLISFFLFRFVEGELLIARLVCFVVAITKYSRKFGLRLHGKVMNDGIWLNKKPPRL
jgi:hypothetical protein